MNESSISVSKGFSDQEILSSIKTGESLDKVLDFIYRNYFDMLKTLVLSNNGNEADAEDIIQEVLIAFIDLVRRDKYRGDASIKSFLYTLTRNMWISELRSRSSAAKRYDHFENEKDKLERDISDYLVYNENLKFVSNLFDSLGHLCKKILTLFFYEGLSMKEILGKVEYENEQVLRNKKYKCQRELIKMIESSPELSTELKNALNYGR